MTNRKAAGFLALFLLLGGLAACGQAGRPASMGAPPASSAQKPPAVPNSPHEEPAPQDVPQEAPEPPAPSLENMMETIDSLCRAPRPLGSSEEYAAAQLLGGRLEAYGYESRLEEFSYNTTSTSLSQRYRQVRELGGEPLLEAALPGGQIDGTSQNVVGSQPREHTKEKILVLSAHYDSTPDSAGVVDNAAGVAVVLETARILAAEELPFALRVVFFGGEEEILIGSRQHVLSMEATERERIIGNISVDTLAYSPQEEFAVLTPLALAQEDAGALAEASPVAAALLADPRVTPEFRSALVGDHIAFHAAGIDSVNLGQSMDEVAHLINSPADTYQLLVPELLPTAVELLADAVRELAAQIGQAP